MLTIGGLELRLEKKKKMNTIFRKQHWTEPRQNPQPTYPGMVNLTGFLKTQFEESYEAVTGILEMLQEDWEPETERFAVKIETSPFCTTYVKRYVMASQEELDSMKQENPELNIVPATKEELTELAARQEGYVDL